jgi:hypothetical protein
LVKTKKTKIWQQQITQEIMWDGAYFWRNFFFFKLSHKGLNNGGSLVLIVFGTGNV